MKLDYIMLPKNFQPRPCPGYRGADLLAHVRDWPSGPVQGDGHCGGQRQEGSRD